MSGSIGTILGGVAGYFTGGASGVLAGAALGNAVDSRRAASKASDQQAQSADEANSLQKYIYDTTRTDQGPYREAGYNALAQLSQGLQPGGQFTQRFGMDQFQADPSYGFRLSEGLKALQNSAAARGSLLSGSTLKGITRYGQDYASNEFSNAYNRFTNDQTNLYNRLAGLSGTGQQSNQLVANAGQNYANQVGQNMLGVGNARASSYLAGQNALTGAIGQGINFYQNQQLLNNLNGGGGTNWGSLADLYSTPSSTSAIW